MKEKRRQPSKNDCVAIKIFVHIAERWGLSCAESAALAGASSTVVFEAWKSGNAPELSAETRERISYLMGIFENLHTIFSDTEQADVWISRPNKAFDDESAKDVMLRNLEGLKQVKKYLDSQVFQ